MTRRIRQIRDAVHGVYALASKTSNTAITVNGHIINWQIEVHDPHGLIDVAGANPSRFVIPSGWSLVELIALAFVTNQSASMAFTVEWLQNGAATNPRTLTREATAPLTTGGQAGQWVHSAPIGVVPGDYFQVRLGGAGTALLRGETNPSWSNWAAVRRLG